jgi:molybdopterin-guanine dinucleotide biosynthesis protein A
VGPLGGLRALLLHATRHQVSHVIALACDMPYVTQGVLLALRDHPSESPALAARRSDSGPWEPLLARYQAEHMLVAVDKALSAGQRSFQAALGRVLVTRFEHEALDRALTDWDCPEDIPG